MSAFRKGFFQLTSYNNVVATKQIYFSPKIMGFHIYANIAGVVGGLE